MLMCAHAHMCAYMCISMYLFSLLWPVATKKKHFFTRNTFTLYLCWLWKIIRKYQIKQFHLHACTCTWAHIFLHACMLVYTHTLCMYALVKASSCISVNLQLCVMYCDLIKWVLLVRLGLVNKMLALSPLTQITNAAKSRFMRFYQVHASANIQGDPKSRIHKIFIILT